MYILQYSVCSPPLQTMLNFGKHSAHQKVGNHHRSASFTYQFGSKYTSPSPTLELNQYNEMGTELDDVTTSIPQVIPQVTFLEVQDAVEKVHSSVCVYNCLSVYYSALAMLSYVPTSG